MLIPRYVVTLNELYIYVYRGAKFAMRTAVSQSSEIAYILGV